MKVGERAARSGPTKGMGRTQNAHAWEWGDALFIVLDPFRRTAVTRGKCKADN